MKTQLLFESNKGIRFERFDNENISRAIVRYESTIIMEYFFRNTKGIEFKSPYISWENLNCCNGWTFDEEYLKDAVQKNKKICAGINFRDIEEVETYISNLDKDKYHYFHKAWRNGKYTIHLMDIVKKGKLSDYYDKEEVIYFYKLLGLNWNFVDIERFNELFNSDLYDIINGSKNYNYSSIEKTIAEDIFTGLLLGYPLESTISIIFQ